MDIGMVETPSALTRWPKYPELSAHNIRDARLYADRADLIAALPIRKGGKVAEIGVWRAAFSKVLASTLEPSQFFAFDIFTGHHYKNWNGLTGHQLFDGLTQRQYYEREMAPFLNVTTIVEGRSQETLRDYTDRSFDLVYVDGDHEYASVKADAELAVEMTADSGFLVFNDYLLFDHNNDAYGIVPVVNDLVVNHGWYIVGYAVNHALYSDIALQR
jgi:Methyltransferase domain